MPKINPFQVIGCWHIFESGGRKYKKLYMQKKIYMLPDYSYVNPNFLFVLSHYIAHLHL